MAQFEPRDQARKKTIKLSDVQTRMERPTSSPSSKNVFRALGNFISGFGSKLKQLVTQSTEKIRRQDPIQSTQMKDRALAAITAVTQENIKKAFDKYSQGRIDRKTFVTEMEMQIRRMALGSAIIGVEGAGNLTENILTAVRNRVSQQLAYLDGFIKDIEGRSLTNRDRSRALQYATAAFSIAQTAQRQFNLDNAKDINKMREMRVLGAAEHCDDCVELADDCQPAGTLPVPGTGTKCGNSCQCRLVKCTDDEDGVTLQRTQENSESDL